MTQSKWLWPSHEMIVSGPGENAQNSKSVRYLLTDEAHLWCVTNPGALAALEGRMGERWDRAALHCTTAAVSGTEIDLLYAKGHQGEWHVRCIHCDKLIWPLWIEQAREHYNGTEVFHWKESANEDEMLQSIHIVCPHCGKEIRDTVRNRIEMDLGAQYVTKNPNASRMVASYRWNCFAPRWKAYASLFAVYLKAIQSVKLGDLAPYEEWVKKYLVLPWTGQYPMLGDSSRSRNFKSAEIVPVPDEMRSLSIDVQEGSAEEGFHLWCLAEQWKKDGSSKRIEYTKLRTWADARAMQKRLEIKDWHVGVDCGDLHGREVFAKCEEYHWLALKLGDELQFAHIIKKAGAMDTIIQIPYYSTTSLESVRIGSHSGITNVKIPRGGNVPPGFCISRAWSKPRVFPILYALKNGASREYGVPSDINAAYIDQVHSYIPAEEKDKKTGVIKKTIWLKTKKHDHAFVMSAQGLVMALIHGYFPIATPEQSAQTAA